MRVGFPDHETETVDAIFIRFAVHANDFSALRDDLLLPVAFVRFIESVDVASRVDEAQSIYLKDA